MEDLSIEDARELLMGDVDSPELVAADFEASKSNAADEQDAPPAHGDESVDDAIFAQGVVGLGVDIVEIERMEAILKRSPSFSERVFSRAERAYCDAKSNPAAHYAVRFAAKEAVVKALGTGFSQGIGVRDIEVERAPSGKPLAKLSGRALEIAQLQGVRELSISLSYTHTDAVACAMAVTESAMKATEKRKDPMEELGRKFKETRSILDDL